MNEQFFITCSYDKKKGFIQNSFFIAKFEFTICDADTFGNGSIKRPDTISVIFHGGNMKLKIWITSLLLLVSFSLFAIADEFASGKDSEIQKAESLAETDRKMDDKIKDINERLSRFGNLRAIVTKTIQEDRPIFTPGQTMVRLSPSDAKEPYIELEAYDFIPQGYSNKAIGQRYKIVRLYFDGDKLSKIESIVTEQNFREDSKYMSRVVDPTPLTEGTKDIEITHQFNREKTYDVTLEKMENTLSNPLKVKFKREFYIPHLTYFEKLFRYTEEYQKRFGSANDKVTVETLKRSLEY